MASTTRATARPRVAPQAPTGKARAEKLVESYRRLAEVFHEVLSEHHPEAVLDRIADTLAGLVPYDALHIYEADPDRRELLPVLVRSDYVDEILRSRPAYGEGITGWAVLHRVPVWTNAAHLDPRAGTVPGTPVEPEALITLPLVARGSVKGALNMYRIGEDARFRGDEFELAKWIGDAAALAIDNAQARARLEHQARTDSLTGVFNHRSFHERLGAELVRASRAHDTVALLMFDIDDFKLVNDVHGHGAGDALLVALAGIVRDAVRTSDVVCRIGGEEFAVIMPSCGVADAVGLAARLRECVRATELAPGGVVTLSIGVAEGPAHAMNPRELLTCAEAAMMTAKARGKDDVVVFGDAVAERPQHEPAWRDVRSIANLRLLQSLASKLNRLSAAREIGETVATELRLLIDYHNCRVLLRDGDDLVPIGFAGDLGTADVVEALRTRVGRGISGRCVETGRSLLVTDSLRCDFARRVPGTTEIDETIAAVPLRHGSSVTGAIVVSKLGVDALDRDDVRLLEVIAGHTSIALENARLYEAQRREAEDAKALLLFAETVSRAPAFPSVCHETVVAAAHMVGSERASLWLRDDDGTFSCRALHGFDVEAAGAAETEAVAQTVVPAERVERLLAGRDAPFLCTADEARAALPPAPWANAFVAPLVSGTGVAGWIAACTDATALTHEKRRLLAGLVYHASTALEKAAMYERQRDSAEVANALLDASREVATGDGVDEVGARVVEVAARACGAAAVTLWVEDVAARELVVRAQAGEPRSGAAGERRLASDVVLSWLEADAPFVVGADDDDGGARVVVAPFRLGGAGLAALTVDLGARDPRESELRILGGLASQAKLALEAAAHYESLERTSVSTIEALANALEANDAYTSTHAQWISDAALEVGRALGLGRAALKRLELAALLHDIGKIGVPSEILRKPGPLDGDELAIVRSHPELGERILEPIERLADVRPIVRARHERWDGEGYPDGKAGAEIPVEARIVLVCDAFHTMTSDRPYRRRLESRVAVARLRAAAGTQLDPAVVEVFLRLLDEGRVREPD